jgi:murein L,D-transpeptidase YcbB/YkuD
VDVTKLVEADAGWPGAAPCTRAGHALTLSALVLLLAGLLAILPAAAATDARADLITRLGAVGTPLAIEGVRLRDADAVRRFYAGRDHRPAWTGADCRPAMLDLATAIATVDGHGLDPDDYHRAALSGPVLCDGDREIVATDAWLMLAAHLAGGRIDPLTVEPTWTARRPGVDLVAALERALADGTVAATLEALAPADPLYTALRAELARLRGALASGGWPLPTDGPTLRPGDRGARVAEVRARLAAEGYALGAVDDAEAYDADLEAAVRDFQARANLEADGVVGRRTLAELVRGPESRIAQVRANLERLRWLPADLGGRHILVDIADFRLEARAGGRTERVHRVVVGREQRQSPSFSAPITQVVFNPWWEVPRRLAVQDKLPLFQRDPVAATRLGFVAIDGEGSEVDVATIDWRAYSARHFPFRLRQRPGPDNALGQVKLLLPNRHDVYLHDTPTRGLFARSQRSFSSGCIRVEDALDLAAWVLAGSEWDRAHIDAAVADGVPVEVRPLAPVPVHLVYRTAVLADDGSVRLLADPYGRDPPLAAALDDAPPR